MILTAFNLLFTGNAILSCMFCNFYLLIPEVIAHLFNSIEEIVIPKKMPTTEAKAEIEKT